METSTKICKECNTEKQTNAFGNKKSNKDGLNRLCKECVNKRAMKYYANRDIISKAKERFTAINKRCNSERYQQDRPKYKYIDNKLNKEEFIKWYIENYFEGCEVDRIDDNKDYSMDNIQLLSKEEHNHKRKLERDGYCKDGYKKCNRCGELKPETKEYFCIHKKQVSQFNPNGFRGICKVCLNNQRKELYQKSKGVKNV